MIKKIKRWFYKRRLKRALKTLRNIDSLMKRADVSRFERRRFWREFSKDNEVREQVYSKIEKQGGLL